MSLLDTASLIVTPNGYKEGKLYSVIPSDGSGDMSVTRATTATRVNAAGLVELVPYNFVLNSEQTWTATGVSIASGVTDPNGGLNAYSVTGINSGTFTDYVGKILNPMPILANEPITFSIYMKGSGTIATYLERSISGSYWVDTEIHTLSNEWQRFTHTYTPSTDAGGIGVFVGNLTGTTATSVDIAFPQVVFGTSALDYQATETRLNIPRLDYSNGSCPSLLVEPQRTNLVTYSEQFDNASWLKGVAGSISANSVISPSGILNADAYTWATSTSSYAYLSQITAGLSQNPNTFSVWLKRPSGSGNRTIRLIISDVLVSTAASSTFTVTETWQRFEFTRASASITALIGVGFLQGLTGTSIASGEILEVWGAQLEAGSYATSYIPTTSASVTRNSEVIKKTGISSLIGQTEGTILIDFILKNPISATNRMLSLTESDWSSGGSIYINAINNEFNVDIVNAGASVASINYSFTPQQNTRYKIAVAYKLNDCKMYVNGVDAGSDTTTGAMPTCSEFYLNALGGGFNAPYEASNINASALWKERLTNAQLAQLTTI